MKPPTRSRQTSRSGKHCSCCTAPATKASSPQATLEMPASAQRASQEPTSDTRQALGGDRPSKRQKLSSTNQQQPPTSCSSQSTDQPIDSDDSSEEELQLGTHPRICNIAQSSQYSDYSESEDEDLPSNIHQTVNNHLHSILPGNGVLFTEPISTPIVSQVKRSIRKDIWKNKFVDLATLLPTSNFSPAPQYTLQMDHQSNLSITPAQRTRKINNIDTWTTAFVRYTAIYSMKFPLETPNLMKYAEIVRDIASRRPGLAFLHYDTQFRMLRESVLFPWDRIHTEFWLMACTPLQTSQPFRSQRPYPKPQFQPRHRRFLENTCWNFNKRSQCLNDKCPHPHVCGFCRGNHTAYTCSLPSKDQNIKSPAPSRSYPTSKASK